MRCSVMPIVDGELNEVGDEEDGSHCGTHRSHDDLQLPASYSCLLSWVYNKVNGSAKLKFLCTKKISSNAGITEMKLKFLETSLMRKK